MSKVMGIYVKFTKTTHQIWPYHVTLASNSENFYFSPNSVLNFRKHYQIWGKLAQEQKRYRQKNKLGVENTPPPSSYRVNSVFFFIFRSLRLFSFALLFLTFHFCIFRGSRTKPFPQLPMNKHYPVDCFGRFFQNVLQLFRFIVIELQFSSTVSRNLVRCIKQSGTVVFQLLHLPFNIL